MNKDRILNIFYKNYGKIIGISLGLIWSILILTLGFIKTIFISLCVYIGYFIGKKIDDKEDLWALLDRLLPPGTLK
ncbi:MAG: DUF2273 domain-containing protein [Thermotaleaceae bacterium]